MTRSSPPYFPPPKAPPQRHGLRRTPPALFPSIMGLFGLGIAWRTVAARVDTPLFSALAELILGATLLLAAVAMGAWLTKPLRRPGVVLDELSILPGRAGMAAFSLCWMLSGAALLPHAPSVAAVLVWIGVAVLAVVAVLISYVLLTGPREQRTVTPVFHLTYVGFIIAAAPLALMGHEAFAREILFATMAIAFVIWAFSIMQLATRIPPEPLRPMLAIHVAPASLFAITAATLGEATLATGFSIMALSMLLIVVVSLRWMLVAGFSPFWGSLTFPLAACATAAMMSLGTSGLWIGAALTMVASALNPYVAQRVVQMWLKGELAQKTNAAVA